MSGGLNVIGLAKGDEYYIWRYADGRDKEAMNSFGRFASNPDLSMTWYDAAVLCQKVRDLQRSANDARNQSESRAGSEDRRGDVKGCAD